MLSHERWLHEIFLFYNISSILEHAVIGLSNLFILFKFPSNFQNYCLLLHLSIENMTQDIKAEDLWS